MPAMRKSTTSGALNLRATIPLREPAARIIPATKRI
jgi:hypothetical protein